MTSEFRLFLQHKIQPMSADDARTFVKERHGTPRENASSGVSALDNVASRKLAARSEEAGRARGLRNDCSQPRVGRTDDESCGGEAFNVGTGLSGCSSEGSGIRELHVRSSEKPIRSNVERVRSRRKSKA